MHLFPEVRFMWTTEKRMDHETQAMAMAMVLSSEGEICLQVRPVFVRPPVRTPAPAGTFITQEPQTLIRKGRSRFNTLGMHCQIPQLTSIQRA